MNNHTNAPDSEVSNSTRWSTGRQSATALAAGLGLTLGAGAQANIIYTDVNPDVTIDDFGESFGIDLDNDGSDDFTVTQESIFNYYSNIIAEGAGSNGVLSSTSGFFPYADRLSDGDPIDATANFENAAYLVYDTSFGEWSPDASGFLGLSFDIAGATHFGWAQISVSDANGGGEGPLTVTLHDYAYESTPRGAIPAGATVSAVPEPGTVALLAMGALPLLGLRRRRRARADA